MRIISEQEAQQMTNFYENVCNKVGCIFARGYIGAASLRSGLPECGKGRNVFLEATLKGECDQSAVLANDSSTGQEVFLQPVTVSPTGAKLQDNTWAGSANGKTKRPFTVDTSFGSKGLVINNLQKRC